MQYAILGAGPAGIVAAETLRKSDQEAEINIYGAEPEPPYSRMAIPYLLAGKIGESGTYLRQKPDHYKSLGINVLQDRVLSIDSQTGNLKLADGSLRPYDRALIATGAHPAVPPIPGIDLPQVQCCWTLDDARKISASIGKGSRVVLMGGGFIGCIIMESLVSLGVELSVVEMGDRMVPRMMNSTAGKMIQRWCESKGVTVRTNAQVTGIEATNGAVQVRLESGESLAADLVVCATGVRPNTGFLADSGIEIDHGILVDDYLQTNLPGVYAAGDVAQGRDHSTGGRQVQAIHPTAVEHGRCAALNMLGKSSLYSGALVMNVLDTLGLVSSSFGAWNGVEGGDEVELCDVARSRYLNLQFDDDILVGATSIGLSEHVGVLNGLIRGRIHLRDWKARLKADPLLIVEAYMANTQII